MAEPLQELRKIRLEKVAKIRALGIDPYPARVKRQQTLVQARKMLGQGVAVAGRIRAKRGHGGIQFFDLQDASGQIQLVFKQDQLSVISRQLLVLLDIGDFLAVQGKVFKTQAGEISVGVADFQLLTKVLRPLPSQWYGLKDDEERFRRRYLDLLMNPQVKEVFFKKSRFWSAVRDYLVKSDFLEVETPVLEAIPGGADARQFTTHHWALDTDFYLRISLELPLKRLMVAGFEKVFEIGRIFRNEGMDAEHLQDYTQLEFYWAYADYEELMKFLEKFYRFVIKQTTGGLVTLRDGQKINWDTKWPRHDYVALFRKAAGLDPVAATEKELCQKALALRLKPKKNASKGRLIDLIYKKTVRPKLIQPSFLVNLPVEISPLAKKVNQNPQVTERILVMAGGTELGNGFSELNDPVDQRQRFEQQQKLREAGDEEAQMYDRDFVEALEYGMPPTAGFGLSERLFAFLLDKPIRETVLFPMMGEKK